MLRREILALKRRGTLRPCCLPSCSAIGRLGASGGVQSSACACLCVCDGLLGVFAAWLGSLLEAPSSGWHE